MTTYMWKPGTPWIGRHDAEIVGSHLEMLRTANEGSLVPEDIVADARHDNSPLHPFFQWDDAQAAGRYRIQQARQLIGSIQITYQSADSEESKPARAFVNVRAPDGPRYAGIVDALSNPITRDIVLRRALAELDAWRKRYETLSELAVICAAIEQSRDVA